MYIPNTWILFSEGFCLTTMNLFLTEIAVQQQTPKNHGEAAQSCRIQIGIFCYHHIVI